MIIVPVEWSLITNSKAVWKDKSNNIFNEETYKESRLKLFGVTIFKRPRTLNVEHDITEENKVVGFMKDGNTG